MAIKTFEHVLILAEDLEKTKNFYDYEPSKGSLIISNCLYPHEVTKVKSGKRRSLVFFVSFKKGINKRAS